MMDTRLTCVFSSYLLPFLRLKELNMEDDRMAAFGATSILIDRDEKETAEGGENGVMEVELHSLPEPPSFTSAKGPYATCIAASAMVDTSRSNFGGGGWQRQIFFGRNGQPVVSPSPVRHKTNMGKSISR